MLIVVLALGMTLVAPIAAAGPLDEPTTAGDPTGSVGECIVISPTKIPPVAVVPCNQANP